MARDTKLRMSIDQRIIDKMDEWLPIVQDKTRGRYNALRLQEIILPCRDGTGDTIIVSFWGGWEITRYHKIEGWNKEQDENGWHLYREPKHMTNVRIETFGKMTTDINREILELLDEIEAQVGLIEEPVYCPVCDHCGETGCCGFIGFLEKHVRGKTDCIYEDQILDDLEKWIKEEDD